MKLLMNLKFRSKIILIFFILFFCTTTASSAIYYNSAAADINRTYQVSADDVLIQIEDLLSTRIRFVTQRMNATLSNRIFADSLGRYLLRPDDYNLVDAMGNMAEFLKDLGMGDQLVYNSCIYTDKRDFETFTLFKNKDFVFEESVFFHAYKDKPDQFFLWFPTMEDPIFTGTEEVIPCVWRFSLQGYVGQQYLVVLLRKAELQRMITGKYAFFDKVVIVDADGHNILGAEDLEFDYTAIHDTDRLTYQDEEYLTVSCVLPDTGWTILGLKSRGELLGNLQNLQSMIFRTAGIVLLAGSLAMLLISRQLTQPLRLLEKRMSYVRNGDLDARFFYPYHDEIGSLANSFNFMIGEIQKLVEQQEANIEDLKKERDLVARIQMQKRKAELKALQAQINPHFLYNTLNAITWQAADQGAEEICLLSSSLGRFFHLSLSKGMEMVRLEDELSHVSSYLDIQKIRYPSSIRYEIQIPDAWREIRVIKLILQPLVENSIYHGLKLKEQGGTIRISGDDTQADVIQLVVWDDGVGMGPEKLAVINRGLSAGITDHAEGYGIYNVNERIRLYYGERFGLRYESAAGAWTKAIITIPLTSQEVDYV